MSNSYWRDSLDYAFDGLDLWAVWSSLTEEQRNGIAQGIETSAENYGQAMGHDVIPNPLDTELRQTRDRHRRESEETDKRHAKEIEGLKDTISSLRGRISYLESQRGN
ncbi:hypothetical protein HOT99_gp220 [Caulobacter phage CcrBL10]|uniref:Uncharacterized protein n=1 Tax=Caulobacter phage CcrBL10 TaxID=2283269 RepID=A0A385EC62_9CAUD|nr:hypothetical protein HOT99_gp220 [Caulobacter phage CcrBL10]AXQ68397.1 hypothetical protein CcrBL10_gp193c [Caulobacter phage CcrBL10]